jgi:hypothetical protein
MSWRSEGLGLLRAAVCYALQIIALQSPGVAAAQRSDGNRMRGLSCGAEAVGGRLSTGRCYKSLDGQA